jgi:hypothetical protein
MIIFSKTDMAVSDKHIAKAILSQVNAPFMLRFNYGMTGIVWSMFIQLNTGCIRKK